jgi:hypothetical protein
MEKIMKTRLITLTTVTALLAGSALAQESAVTGAAGGAVTGAIVGGPVGAAVGGVAGAIAGVAIDPPPPRVVTYVSQAPVPAETVVIEEKVVVGATLPQTVVVQPVPEDPRYAYAYVNEQRVIIEPSSRTVIQVVN